MNIRKIGAVAIAAGTLASVGIPAAANAATAPASFSEVKQSKLANVTKSLSSLKKVTLKLRKDHVSTKNKKAKKYAFKYATRAGKAVDAYVGHDVKTHNTKALKKKVNTLNKTQKGWTFSIEQNGHVGFHDTF